METNSPQRKGWTRWAIVGSLAAALAGGLGVAGALSQTAELGAQAESGASGARAMPAHWGGGGRFMGRRFDRVLEEIEATPEQEEKLWEIAGETFTSVWPMAREFRGAREDLQELLSAPTIDRAAIEKLRSERVAAVGALSRTVTAAVVEAAEVLTPEQRAELAEILQERRGHHRW
jgi:protein CpxP